MSAGMSISAIDSSDFVRLVVNPKKVNILISKRLLIASVINGLKAFLISAKKTMFVFFFSKKLLNFR